MDARVYNTMYFKTTRYSIRIFKVIRYFFKYAQIQILTRKMYFIYVPFMFSTKDIYRHSITTFRHSRLRFFDFHYKGLYLFYNYNKILYAYKIH